MSYLSFFIKCLKIRFFSNRFCIKEILSTKPYDGTYLVPKRL